MILLQQLREKKKPAKPQKCYFTKGRKRIKGKMEKGDVIPFIIIQDRIHDQVLQHFGFVASRAREGEFQVNHNLDGLYIVFQIDYVCIFRMLWLVISDYGRIHS